MSRAAWSCRSARTVVVAGWIAVGVLATRGTAPAGDAAGSAPGPSKRIVCTFLPVYVFTLNVVGDAAGVEVKLLVSADLGCPHQYSARPADLKAVAGADVIVANGLGMEPFLDGLLRSAPRAKVITISDECDLIEAGEPHVHAPGEKCDHQHGPINGHVWTSPAQATKQVRLLARRLGELDPARAANYATNAEAYAGRLTALHERLTAAASGFRHRKVVTSHDAFDYLARDLGLEVVTTIESEPGHAPSAHRMTEIIKEIREARAAAIFYEPSGSDRLPQTIAKEAGIAAYPLNPFTSLTNTPTARSYEEVMDANLTVLQKALGSGP